MSTASPRSSSAGSSLLMASSPSPQCQPRRPINPPPYRLDFEPLTTVSDKKHVSKVAAAETLQGSISLPVGQVESKASKLLAPCHKHPRRVPGMPRGVVYMLHGWAQNVHVFSNRARKLTKRLNKVGYKVVFLQGPHRLPPVEGASTCSIDEHDRKTTNTNGIKSEFSREYAYAWFLYDEEHQSGSEEPMLKPSPNGKFRGMETSLTFLQNELRADRIEFLGTNHQEDALPPSFLLGFSQGAVLVHKVATLACETSDTSGTNASSSSFGGPWKDIKKCVLVSGFSFTTSIRRDYVLEAHKCNDNDTAQCGSETQQGNTSRRNISMPSFHVIGKKDSRVSPYLTMELYDLEPCFSRTEKVLWEHNRGHVLPQDLNFCDRLIEFLAAM